MGAEMCARIVLTMFIRYGEAMTPAAVTKITKWGNSQGVLISKNVCEKAGMGVGDNVTIVIDAPSA